MRHCGSLIPLTANMPGPPLVFIPGAGDSITSMLSLANSMSSVGPIYGLQPRGVDGKSTPFNDIESEADFYIYEIKRIFGSRFHIVGHSHGGVVGFEMSRRLATMHQPVLSVTMIDSILPDNQCAPKYSNLDIFIKFVDAIECRFKIKLDLCFDNLIYDDVNEFTNELYKLMVRSEAGPRGLKRDDLIGPIATFSAALRAPYPLDNIYNGPATLLTTLGSHMHKKKNISRDRHNIARWKEHAPFLKIFSSPGDHFSILEHPQVAGISNIIRDNIKII